MKKSQLRHIIRQIIQEQKSKSTEVYSPEGCEKFDLYGYIMNSGNYPTYNSITYQNMSNDQVVSVWCGRCQDALNANGSFSFVSQIYQPPRDEPNCKCCPQYQNIDWPGEPDPRPDLPFKDPNRDVDVNVRPPKPPKPPRPERPITPITLGDESDDFDINMNYGAWYCAGDALLEVDPSVTSTDCAYIANYDNPNNLTGYSSLQSCIAASTCTGPTDEVDDDQFTWTNEDGEVISCTSDEGSNTVNDEFCNECVDVFEASENLIITFAKGSIQFDGFGVGSFEGEPIPSLPSWTWQGVYNLFNGTNQSGLYNSAYCTCCNNWQEAVVDLIGVINADILNNISLEESLKTRLQKLANIRKK